jgi:DegV family protein with EDD domain
MAQVAVTTDSTQYMPADVAHRHGIGIVSLYCGWSGEQTRELELGGYDDFYHRLADDPELPTTSQPSIGDYVDLWQPLLDSGHDIVSVHLAGGISGTVEAARQARELLVEDGVGERIEVIDGETGCGGLALLALAGAAAASEGKSREEVAAHIRAAKDKLRIWFALDTLTYLRRGGRIGKAQAWVGGTLRIKPILSLEYEITPVERVRTSARAFERMVDYAHELKRIGADAWVVQHIQAPAEAERLAARCREVFGSEPLFVSEIGPVIGTYTGPGPLGVGGVAAAALN